MNKARKLDEQSVQVINAVKAESARAGVNGKQLAQAIGRDRTYIYSRFQYKKAFDTNDLQGIAEYLGITVADIFRSATIGTEQRLAA